MSNYGLFPVPRPDFQTLKNVQTQKELIFAMRSNGPLTPSCSVVPRWPLIVTTFFQSTGFWLISLSMTIQQRISKLTLTLPFKILLASCVLIWVWILQPPKLVGCQMTMQNVHLLDSWSLKTTWKLSPVTSLSWRTILKGQRRFLCTLFILWVIPVVYCHDISYLS